jgi:hypothetical protein
MHQFHPLTLTLALAMAWAGADACAAERIYQWTDAQGVTHYTDRPPAQGEYRDRQVDGRQPARTPMAEPEPVGDDTIVAENADMLALQRQENCNRARQNLNTLRRSPQVRLDRDGDGTPEPLSDAERTHQMEVAAQQVRRYCEG